MCSNKCAKPVRPGRSLREPTLYVTSTAITGVLWSSTVITRKPLARRVSFNSTSGFRVALCRGATRKREKDYRDKQPSMQSHAIKLLYKIPRAIRLIVTSEDDSVAPLVGWLESRDVEFMRQRHDCQAT